MYVNKTENRILFEIKMWYISGLLRPETMKLLGTKKI